MGDRGGSGVTSKLHRNTRRGGTLNIACSPVSFYIGGVRCKCGFTSTENISWMEKLWTVLSEPCAGIISHPK